MSHFHLIGIGGTGLSAIARLLIESGHIVSGSDLVPSPYTENLERIGAKIFFGHDANHVMGADTIIRSSAISDNNVEVLAAFNAHIPVFKRIDFLDFLTEGKKVIAFAGTHGKTTSTSMCAWVFSQVGLDPTYIIGGVPKNLGKNAHSGEGEYFVIEADEYDRMFLGLHPYVLGITTIEHDHPDDYPTEEDYFQAFNDLIKQVQSDGMIIGDGNDPGVSMVLSNVNNPKKFKTYGFDTTNDFLISNVEHIVGDGVKFTWLDSSHSNNLQLVRLAIPGDHNARNASAVLSVCAYLGLPLAKCVSALESFVGTERRFDIHGTAKGVTIIDDYGHHPTEIKATIAAARAKYPKKQIWAVWQPHTFSRTKELFDDFLNAFDQADHVIVSEIYASREKKEDFSANQLVLKMTHPNSIFISTLQEITDYLIANIGSNDVLLVFSAGDANKISVKVFLDLKNQENQEPIK